MNTLDLKREIDYSQVKPRIIFSKDYETFAISSSFLRNLTIVQFKNDDKTEVD